MTGPRQRARAFALALPVLLLLPHAASAANARDVVTHPGYACALTTAGGAKCWGGAALGNGTEEDSALPVDVTGLEDGVLALSHGTSLGHMCAVTMSGGVWCWGYNSDGQLGNGTTAESTVPVAVSGLSSGVVDVTAGALHSCALTTGGGVWCWGFNQFGQLGNGNTVNSSVPVAVSGLSSGVTAISAGSIHTCALTTGGDMYCWGDNSYGQIGDDSSSQRSTPVAVAGFSANVVQMDTGGRRTCAVTTGGAAWCWGYWGEDYPCCEIIARVPWPIDALTSGVRAINVSAHYCALMDSGETRCWGENAYGQLGDGTTTDSEEPVVVRGFHEFTSLDTSGSASCGVTKVGGVFCWGYNRSGQLGNGTFLGQLVPGAVLGFGGAGSGLPAAPGLAPWALATLVAIVGAIGIARSAGGRRRT